MILEHLYQGEPGAWKITFRASAQELARALQEAEGQTEQDRLADAVNRAILAPDGFSTVWTKAVEKAGLTPVTDPDFSLQALNKDEGFRASATFFALPPLELGRYTGFVQAVEPRPIRRLTIELEINQHHGPEDRAADEAGRAALRRRVTAEIYQKRCRQAEELARRKLLVQLGDQVKGALPKKLAGISYFAEQRRFNLSLQAQGVNLDRYLRWRRQMPHPPPPPPHADSERKLRSQLGLLLVARREGLWPTDAEINAALAAWDEKKDGERTFPANDRNKAALKLARRRASDFILARSTLLPPPAEPTVVETL